MKDDLYREKSIKKISSPENLSDYLRVTTPGMWAILAGTALAILGLLGWSFFMTINSYAYGTAVVESGLLTVTFDDTANAKMVTKDMEIIVEDRYLPIKSISYDDEGNVMAMTSTDMPDGEYPAKTCFRQTKMIKMLVN